jgi:hypothetical protein
MAAPIITCTTIEQLGVVHFLWAKDMGAKDIHKVMVPIYGEHCLSFQALLLVWPFETTSFGERFPDDNAVERSVSAWCRQQPPRILRRSSLGACEKVGKVFKFVWRYFAK